MKRRGRSALGKGNAGRLVRELWSDQELLNLAMKIENEEAYIVEALIWKAREAAMEANAALISTPPDQTAAIKALQDEILRYSTLVKWIREIARDARATDSLMSEDERNDLDHLLYEIGDQAPVE